MRIYFSYVEIDGTHILAGPFWTRKEAEKHVEKYYAAHSGHYGDYGADDLENLIEQIEPVYPDLAERLKQLRAKEKSL